MGVDVIAVFSIFNKAERIILLNFLHGAPWRGVVVFQRLMRKSTHSDELLVRLRYNKDTSRNQRPVPVLMCPYFLDIDGLADTLLFNPT